MNATSPQQDIILEPADRLLVHNIKLMTAPPLSEWNGQALSRTQLKEIQIEDLLQRNPIEIDIHKVASHLEGKRVMITACLWYSLSQVHWLLYHVDDLLFLLYKSLKIW